MSDAPLRILQLYPKEDYFTGAAIQVRELALGLHTRGHDVIIGTRPSDIWSAKTREAGVPHHALPMASEVDLRSVRQLVGILRAHRTQMRSSPCASRSSAGSSGRGWPPRRSR